MSSNTAQLSNKKALQNLTMLIIQIGFAKYSNSLGRCSALVDYTLFRNSQMTNQGF